jgi:hypothetical protein
LRREKLERNQRRSRAGVAKSSRTDMAVAAAAAANSNDNNGYPTTPLQHPTVVAATSAAAAVGDDTEASLWVGDLPLAWTKPSLVKTKSRSSNYKRLSELLYRYNLPNVPLPWIKSVVRKAYHCKKEQETCAPAHDPTGATVDQRGHDQHQHNGHRSTTGTRDADDARSGQHHPPRPYLGYAIVVYRSAEEAAAAREHLDGLKVSMETVFQDKDSSYDVVLPSFILVARPAEKNSSKSGNSNNDSSSCASDNKNGDTTNPICHDLSPVGLDPPLADQLQPLSDDELRHRLLALKKRNRRLELATRSKTAKKDSSHEHSIDCDTPKTMDDHDDNGIASMLKNMKHDKLVAMVVAEYHMLAQAGQQPRRVRRYQGCLIPIAIRDCLLKLLENLLWPAQHQRPMLTSERYLVLVTSTSATPHYKELREACQRLMQWADPTYYYSGIAVTKNFIASPHIDERDQSFQYAVSLGNFKNHSSSSSSSSGDAGGDAGGGELCVEGKECRKSQARDGKNDESNNCLSGDDTFVNVVNTHNRIARVDGRRVHWVRTWAGGDRYSLIFYDTTDRNTTPVMEGGLDVLYLQ